MITKKEINNHNYELTPEQEANIDVLLEKMNIIRAAYGKPMTVTSGLRSLEDQMRINPKAPKSTHVLGAAVDILDKNGELYKWCKANTKLLEEAGLYLEERQGPWQHFQIFPPKSRSRWFHP